MYLLSESDCEQLIRAFVGSWQKELDDTGRFYFPFYPSRDSDPPKKKADIGEIAEYSKGGPSLVKRIADVIGANGSLEEWPMYCDDAEIDRLFSPNPLGGPDTVTLFQASLMLGQRILGFTPGAFFSKPLELAEEVVAGRIDPRHPRTLIRYSERPCEIPDLSWKLYPEELQSYALARWGRGVYTEGEMAERIDGPPGEADREEGEVDEMNSRMALYCMAQMLKEKSPKYDRSGKPNAHQIGKAVAESADKFFGEDKHQLASFNKKLGRILREFGE